MTTVKTLTVEDFPPELHATAKALAAMRRMYLRDAVIEAVQMWCEAQQQGRLRAAADGR